MPVINPETGEKEAEVEGGEYILSRDTVNNNREVANALLDSSMNRGGQPVKPFWKNRPYERVNFQRINDSQQAVRKFASGGIFNAQKSVAKEETKPEITKTENPRKR